MMIPFESIIIPNYMLISQWGLKDTIAGLTLPFLAIVLVIAAGRRLASPRGGQ